MVLRCHSTLILFTATAAAAAAAVAAAHSAASVPGTRVATRFGDVDGTVVRSRGGSLVRQWLSIPYALPPTGARRFAPPDPWVGRFPGGRLIASRAGVYCPQTPYQGQGAGSLPTGQEDCLVLSIWSPTNNASSSSSSSSATRRSRASLLPVLFWVHGGDFIQGNGDQYNGTELVAKHNVVLVAINYRLGHLGWLQPVAGHGNFGLKDQREALRWVRSNIASFGGDGSRVLLFGESAGAISIAAHLLSPASDGLFATALMESGYPSAKAQAYALSIAGKYATAAGCDSNVTGGDTKVLLACLRAAPLSRLQAAAAAATKLPPGALPFDEIGWGPTVDGQSTGLPETPLSALAAGRVNGGRARLLAGTNSDEGSVFVYPHYPKGLNASAFELLMRSMISSGESGGGRGTHGLVNQTLLKLVLAEYPPNSTHGADNCALASRALSDYSFTCGTRRLLLGVARQGLVAAAYRFGQRAAADTSPPELGVEHGDEVPFVFDQGSWVGTPGFTPAEEALATSIGRVWSNFARNGSVPWPAFGKSPPLEWLFRAGPTEGQLQPYSDSSACDFWDRNLL